MGNDRRVAVADRRERKPGDWGGVILAGGPGTANFALANRFPVPGFPMADGRPLLGHLVAALADAGIRRVAVTISEGVTRGAVVDLLEQIDVSGVDLVWNSDNGYRGTAGALKDLASFVGSSSFVVLNPQLWLDRVDLQAVCAAHRQRDAAATVVLEERGLRAELENFRIDSNGLVSDFCSLHHSRDNRRQLQAAGVYVFEPTVLEMIDDDGYVDIKEQLLPALREGGHRIQGHRLSQPLSRIDSVETYYHLNRSILLNGWQERASVRQATSEVLDGIRIGRRTEIAPDADLLGPVMVGDDCRIESGARVVGPAIICRGTTVERSALVRESILWRNSRVEARASVQYSVVTDHCAVPGGESVVGGVVVGSEASRNGLLIACATHANDDERMIVERKGRLRPLDERRLRRGAYHVFKRGFDIAASAVGLAISLPLLAVIAVLVKLESPGPVLYVQPRCGRDGRVFAMRKFRTMVTDADRLQGELRESNETRGPMFKIAKDPRVTRVGTWLRRTSLDELPQLWNVLRGNMSLVGPRPLVMSEMSWCPRWRDLRLRVKPGITGLWQIHGREEQTFEDWIHYDIEYVRNQSLLVDLRILATTVVAVFRDGARLTNHGRDGKRTTAVAPGPRVVGRHPS